MKNIYLIILLSLFFAQKSIAQIDTIDVKKNRLIINNIKPGISNYLVYIEKPDGTLMDLSLWQREVYFGTFRNKEVIFVKQQWKNQNQVKRKYLYSINNKENFYPIYHYRKSGKNKIEAFNFGLKKVVLADSVQNNSNKEFYVELKTPTLNWELDIEILQTLPFKKDKTFAINFYHPGGKSLPKYYLYKVIGQDDYITINGEKINCWLLKIEYDKSSYATFWISKNKKEMLKMVEHFGQIKRFKIKYTL